MGLLEGCAYLFGNIQPDILFRTYLSGTAPGDECRGHNYKTAMMRIGKMTREMMADGISAAYTLGKITHYAADIFTYPHNPDLFHDTLLNHMKYERKLDDCLQSSLERGVWKSFEISSNPENFLEDKHAEYLGAEISPDNDLEYIVPSALALRRAFAFIPSRFRAVAGNLR